MFLVATAVLSAVARSVSVLGYWGSGNIIGVDYVAYALPVGIALAIAVYLVFFRLRESEMLSHLVVLFLIVLGGLFLQDGAFLKALGLLPVVGSQASIATELFSQFLFWVAMIAAMRMGGVSPYRAVGVAEGCMSASALVLGTAMFGRGDVSGAVAAAATYGTLVVVWYLLRRMQQMSATVIPVEEAADDPIAVACASVASARGLSPRESEVLLLLAQGRSRTFIQSELFLSDGTVKTHIRHIYQKLDVHSKQELISLIQKC
ncbi:LuxR family transcriptional regulator [Eggerthellaceae bacterium 24-137]